MVKPMTMSGCAYSEAGEGTSLPKKGTARSLRELGMSAICCSAESSP